MVTFLFWTLTSWWSSLCENQYFNYVDHIVSYNYYLATINLLHSVWNIGAFIVSVRILYISDTAIVTKVLNTSDKEDLNNFHLDYFSQDTGKGFILPPLYGQHFSVSSNQSNGYITPLKQKPCCPAIVPRYKGHG